MTPRSASARHSEFESAHSEFESHSCSVSAQVCFVYDSHRLRKQPNEACRHGLSFPAHDWSHAVVACTPIRYQQSASNCRSASCNALQSPNMQTHTCTMSTLPARGSLQSIDHFTIEQRKLITLKGFMHGARYISVGGVVCVHTTADSACSMCKVALSPGVRTPCLADGSHTLMATQRGSR